MPREVVRTARGMIQQEVGELGLVLPFRHSPDRHHPYVGWYATPALAADTCACVFCSCARAGRDVFLGANRREAVKQTDRYAEEHTE